MIADLGKRGEDLAQAYLINQGYRILARNWRSGHREIDLIVAGPDGVIFVEVKTRRTARFGHPEEFVDEQKQAHLVSAASDWMMQTDYEGEIRFDVMAILLPPSGPPQIRHLPDAFWPFPSIE